MSFVRSLYSVTVGAALLLGASSAAAEGLSARPAQIPAAPRAALEKDIAAERAAHPEAFAAVRRLRGLDPAVYRTFKNPRPNAASELRALGKAALLPLLHELAFEARPTAGMSGEERTALVTGMLEAVGLLRDPRSGPVLRAAFEGAADPGVQRAAAEGLGRLCGDAELGALAAHAAAADPRSPAAVRGLGQCRRVEGATVLASLLATAKDADAAERAAGALGLVGSSWAWKALGPGAEAAGLAVREVAARALVAALPRHAGATRARLAAAIVMVDHPALPALLAAARATATPDLAAVLDDLRRRLGR